MVRGIRPETGRPPLTIMDGPRFADDLTHTPPGTHPPPVIVRGIRPETGRIPLTIMIDLGVGFAIEGFVVGVV